MARSFPIRWDAQGLVPVVVQDAASGEVLMLAYADREALQRTLTTGLAHFWSRSRRRLWCKGETSGHYLHVAEVRVDCDADALLYRARPQGPACHTGERTCFYRRVGGPCTATSAEAAEGQDPSLCDPSAPSAASTAPEEES